MQRNQFTFCKHSFMNHFLREPDRARKRYPHILLICGYTVQMDEKRLMPKIFWKKPCHWRDTGP